ncbi:rds1 [Colletotrichum higginsianum]|nr:rds1 [Colletotrichum higginsianum]
MADQEIGHATVITNLLGPQAPRQCTYNYPVSNLREYIDFNQKLTRWARPASTASSPTSTPAPPPSSCCRASPSRPASR